MDPAHRGWPPQAGANTHAGSPEQQHSQPQQQQQQQPPPSRPAYGAQSPPQGPTGLPPPPPGGPFPHFHQQAPSLANLAGISQSAARQPPPTGRPEPPPQGPQLPLPGFSQATGQPGAAERERERAREVEQIQIKEEEEERRHREQQERQRLEQAPPHPSQQGPPMPLHQPVAVGPRSVHGPNGLLGTPGQPQPQMPMGAPSGPGNIFAGGPVQPANQPPGPAGQQMQPGMPMPFAPGQQPPPTQQPQQQQMSQQQSQGPGQQPILNDALSYLDQVKVQFHEHPEVYNKFLDIMKDFKSGAIDTPGVIGRVSTLFTGNPDLIQGFNTFLPPGYRIECGTDNDPNSIRVTTPMGTTVSSMPQPRPLSRQGDGQDLVRPANGTFTPQPGQAAPSVQMMFSPNGRPIGPAAPAQQQHFSPMEAARQQEQQQAMHQQEQRGVNSLQNAVSAATGAAALRAGGSPRATPLPGQQDPNAQADGQPAQPGLEKRGPVEFNHAISYVNKIKNRFASHPDIYKQFLEILQTYQRESKPIQDVYSQVTHLFKTAPDLLEDFKQFLPESAAHAKAAEQQRQRAEESVMMSNVRGEGGGMYGSPVMSRETHIGTPSHGRGNLPPVGNFAPTPISKDNKRKRGDRQGTVGSAMEGGPGPSGGKVGAFGAQQGGKRLKQTHPTAGKGPSDQPPPSPTLVPPLPQPIPPTTTSAATHEELSFFDRAKKAIGNKNTMNEFLKLCNLFSQDFIDRTTLIHRARSFIGGNPDLMKWFMDFIGYDEKDIIIENKAREPVVPGGRISLSNCRGLGPSYRLLPKRERVKTCSGRDELCNSVLNDEWASHPTWASEDSGFIAHRKNVHEEGLHRIEEERHDYDYNIEAASRTIQLLEPIAQQLRRLDNDAQVNYSLPSGLGGQSETIYKRVIMKLYGRDKGQDVIRQLHDGPYTVIPVLLNRLKERLETWKMAQREWEKVWREQTQKMFWKSLDHQAANARTNDRRQFQTKTLQGEIQIKFEEQKKEEQKIPGSMRGKPQLEARVDDVDVIVDVTWLVLVHIEAQQATDSPRLAPFVRDFVPLFFGIPAEEFETKLKARIGGTPLAAVDESMSGAEDSGSERKTARKNGKAGNLHRLAVDKGPKGRFGRKERDDSASASRASTPDVASHAGDEGAAVDGMAIDAPGTGTVTPAADEPVIPVGPRRSGRWLDHPTTDEEGKESKKIDPNEAQPRTTYRMWANTPIYCFIRMFLHLYERLHKLKTSEHECRDIVKNAKKPKPAIDLGIVDKLPTDFFADTSPTANYYQQMLHKFLEVLQGDIEFVNDSVEDCLRRFYLQAGYPLYAFEKMVQSLVRYGGQVVSQETSGGNKEKSWDMVNLWKKDRARGDGVSAVQVTDYRKAAEKFIGTEKLGGTEGCYAIDWDDENKTVKVFTVKKDDPYATADEVSVLDKENLWRYYVASFSSVDNTDGVSQKDLRQVLLTRNMRDVGADLKADHFLPGLPLATADSVPEGPDADASADPEVKERLLARFTEAKNDEQLTLRIALNNYHIVFQPGTAESVAQDIRQREENTDGVKAAEETRTTREEMMREGLVLNNEGMKGLSREEVEKRNLEFAELGGGVDAVADAGEEGSGRMEVDE